MLKLSKQAILCLQFKCQEQKLGASVGLEHYTAGLTEISCVKQCVAKYTDV